MQSYANIISRHFAFKKNPDIKKSLFPVCVRLSDPTFVLKRGHLDYSAGNQINTINWSIETSQRSLVHALSCEYGRSRTLGGTERKEKRERAKEKKRTEVLGASFKNSCVTSRV